MLTRLIILLVVIIFSVACGRSAIQKQSIPAQLSIQVKDPLFRKLTETTELVEIKASGEFKPGTFLVQGIALQIPDDTKFTFELSLPIDNPSQISTGKARGTLWTSAPLSIGGVPMAQKIILANGQATAEVDLVSTMGVFLLNAIQSQVIGTISGADVKDLFRSITVERAVLNLRPDSPLDLGTLHLTMAPKSKVELTNLLFDQAWNYKGDCLCSLKFAHDCRYAGEKIDLDFNGGDASLLFKLQKLDNVFMLAGQNKGSHLSLKEAKYSFGKQKKSSVMANVALLDFQYFTWQKVGGEAKARMHVLASMILHKTLVELRNPTVTLSAAFNHPAPVTLQIDREPEHRQILVSTGNDNLADSLDIHIQRKNTNAVIALKNAHIGPMSIDKSGDLSFVLSKGKAILHHVEWQNGKKEFRLVASRDSVLSITNGLSMTLVRAQNGTNYELPLSIQFGSASLNGSFGIIKLQDLHGDLVVKAAEEISVSGNLAFNIIQSQMLGTNNLNVKMHGIDIAHECGKAIAHFNQCSVSVPKKVLLDEIGKALPDEKVFQLDKIVLSKQKWRYRNASITSISLHKLALADIRAIGKDQGQFNGSADIEVIGNVEKCSIFSMGKKSCQWQDCPWSANAHLVGSGNLKYEFIPKDSLSNSEFKYRLALNLPLPDQFDIDWSKVSGGLMEKAERFAIIRFIKRAPPVALNHQGQLKLFSGRDNQLRSLRIKDFKTKPANDGIEMDFTAEAVL